MYDIMSEVLPLTVVGSKSHLIKNSIVPQNLKSSVCTIFASNIHDAKRANPNRVNTSIFRTGPCYYKTIIFDCEATIFVSILHHLITQYCIIVLPFISDTAQDVQ